MLADGGPGTGNGVVGSSAAVTLGLVAILLGALARTPLVVTHDLPFAAEMCERAVILSGGRIAADGPTRAILADAELLARHDLELPAGFDPALVRPR